MCYLVLMLVWEHNNYRLETQQTQEEWNVIFQIQNCVHKCKVIPTMVAGTRDVIGQRSKHYNCHSNSTQILDNSECCNFTSTQPLGIRSWTPYCSICSLRYSQEKKTSFYSEFNMIIKGKVSSSVCLFSLQSSKPSSMNIHIATRFEICNLNELHL